MSPIRPQQSYHPAPSKSRPSQPIRRARKRATPVRFGNARLYVASLADIIRSKKAAGRARDRAVLPLLEKAIEEAEATRHPQSPTGRSQERK
jgi:hypothetical protein